MSKARKTLLGVGEAVPWFRAPVVDGSPAYAFDTVGGQAVLMLFFGAASAPAARQALAKVVRRRALFDDQAACFFGITVDPADAAEKRIRQALPGLRFFLDYDREISAAVGAAPDGETYFPHWLLLDRTLRVAGRFALEEGDAALAATASLASAPPAQDWAPVVLVPDILEAELCRHLIDLYEADGGEDSGFMRDVDGRTRLVLDPEHKIRRDWLIEDPALARALNLRLIHRLLPMVGRAFSFQPTRVERLLVGCYEAETGGHFRAHRDNTTLGTAHRRLAVTINLNAGEYEGGDLNFPEFGPRLYRAPTGGAIIFSCSLLHRAMPVTRGRRFAFLPFLYDEAGAQLRERNAGFLEGEMANYRADQDVVVG
jgi:peroxiredoxin